MVLATFRLFIFPGLPHIPTALVPQNHMHTATAQILRRLPTQIKIPFPEHSTRIHYPREAAMQILNPFQITTNRIPHILRFRQPGIPRLGIRLPIRPHRPVIRTQGRVGIRPIPTLVEPLVEWAQAVRRVRQVPVAPEPLEVLAA
ncbi:MAG: hypothetical protein CL489_01145 [Acidobacteria bacterium]|nr:hypothetical protein [Acidobacteriota bacterium]